jgi:hypothetical protein
VGDLASGARAGRMDRRTQLAKDAQDKERIKAERLREALRANLRRRKAKPQSPEPDEPKA